MEPRPVRHRLVTGDPQEEEKDRVPSEVLNRGGLLGELSAVALRRSPDDVDKTAAEDAAAEEEAEPALP
jgi:hypothetical protein